MPLIRVGVLCLSIATTACFPSRFFPCQVVTLDQPEIYTVLSRYRWSYFDTSCRPSTPKELLIRRESYSVYVLLRGDHPAKVYLGLRPLHSARFELRGVTDQRVLILSGLFGRKITSLNLRTLSEMSLNERADGTGTLTFGPTPPFLSAGVGMAWPGLAESPAFDSIPRARSVYDI